MSVRNRGTRFVALVLVIALVATIAAGCGNGGSSSSTSGGSSTGAAIKVGMVTDTAGIGDKSFNDLTWAGLQKAKKDFGVDIKYLQSTTAADYDTNLTSLATAGYNPVIAVGFLLTDNVSKISTALPDTKFAGIDEFFDPVPKNVVGLNFREEEGCYLAGIVAAKATTDPSIGARINNQKVVGFVGGMDVPLIQKFEAGYKAGVASVDPSIKVISLYAGSFSDPTKGNELGLSEISQGADVIFAAAGGTGEGVFRACQDTKKAYFIGVDADQFNTIKNSGDTILTSVMKAVDVVAYETVKDAVEGKFPAGQIKTFGLKEGGMKLAPYHDFESKIPQATKDAVATAQQAIIDGSITVPTKP